MTSVYSNFSVLYLRNLSLYLSIKASILLYLESAQGLRYSPHRFYGTLRTDFTVSLHRGYGTVRTGFTVQSVQGSRYSPYRVYGTVRTEVTVQSEQGPLPLNAPLAHDGLRVVVSPGPHVPHHTKNVIKIFLQKCRREL